MGQAIRTNDESSEGRLGAPFAGLDAPFDELSVPASGRRARSAADTLRYVDADPFADTMAAPTSDAAARLARPDWCVDLETSLVSMTTFELWAAIEQGRVDPGALVWREGLECWTRVDHIPELGWAIPATPAPEAEPSAAATPVSFAPPAARAGESAARPEQAPSILPATPPRADPPLPAASRRPPARGRWIALGAAVAAAAVATALLTPSLGAPPEQPAPQVLAGGAPRGELVQGGAPSGLSLEGAADPAPDRREDMSRHDERGQRRLPRGGHRAYGR